AQPPGAATQNAGRPAEYRRGDADGALAGAFATIDATYVQAREHHNPMEPHATIALWEGERLTLYDKTQWVENDRAEIANVFGIAPDAIRVISPFVGAPSARRSAPGRTSRLR